MLLIQLLFTISLASVTNCYTPPWYKAPCYNHGNIKKENKPNTSQSKLETYFSIDQLTSKYKNEIIIGSTIFTAYQLFCLRLYYAKSYVTKTTTWGSFNKNIPIDSLYEIPQEKFLADLETVIYRTFSDDKYNSAYKDTEPLSLFIKAAQKEIKQLEKFVNLYWYCTIPLISFLFPDYDDELILAQEKIERLNYMIELVTKKLCELHS